MEKKKQILIEAVVFILLCIMAFDMRLKVVDYTVQSDKISADVKIALITDLHSCYYGDGQRRLLDRIDAQKPDIVLLGGDIFDDVMPEDNSQILVSELAKKYDTYYVSGNHEWWSGRMKEIFDYITRSGVVVLRGDSIDAMKNGQRITVCGIDDPDNNNKKGFGWRDQLDSAGKSLKADSYNILLAHRPEKADEYFEYDFDLVLSGHAHGGQWRIPLVMNGFYAPNQGFFPKLAGGRYDSDTGVLVVSRGLARENTRLPRIFNRPELVFVTLKPQ